MIDSLSPFLVALSLYGAYAITVPKWARYGFAAWVFADAGWVVYFVSQGQWSAAVLFAVYTALAVKGWCQV